MKFQKLFDFPQDQLEFIKPFVSDVITWQEMEKTHCGRLLPKQRQALLSSRIPQLQFMDIEMVIKNGKEFWVCGGVMPFEYMSVWRKLK